MHIGAREWGIRERERIASFRQCLPSSLTHGRERHVPSPLIIFSSFSSFLSVRSIFVAPSRHHSAPRPAGERTCYHLSIPLAPAPTAIAPSSSHSHKWRNLKSACAGTRLRSLRGFPLGRRLCAISRDFVSVLRPRFLWPTAPPEQVEPPRPPGPKLQVKPLMLFACGEGGGGGAQKNQNPDSAATQPRNQG